MTTAWNLLIANSTLSAGDAWQHLNAQKSGRAIVIMSDNLSAVYNYSLNAATMQNMTASVSVELAATVSKNESASLISKLETKI